MDFNNYSFGKIDYKKLFKTGTLVVGAILIFISIFIPYPIFIYTAITGSILIAIIKFKDYLDSKHKNSKSKNKIQITQISSSDPTKVIATCPYCNQKLRLPYNKGVHKVLCPKCKCEFKVKNK